MVDVEVMVDIFVHRSAESTMILINVRHRHLVDFCSLPYYTKISGPLRWVDCYLHGISRHKDYQGTCLFSRKEGDASLTDSK